MPVKLELDWPGKSEPFPPIEHRVLVEDKKLSNTKNDPDTENILIHGDNLLALKALEKKFAGSVKCIYIDPPYNTGAAFEQYDDNFEHSEWLKLMTPRLKLLRTLLANDGSIWISIDDEEQAYLKVICDEIFGRSNFVEAVIWQRAYAPVSLKKTISRSHEYILIYAKQKSEWQINFLPRTDEMNSRYRNPDNDPRGDWTSGDCSVGIYNASNDYSITTPSGRIVNPTLGTSWRFSKEKFEELVKDNRIWFGEDGNNVPRVKRFLTDVRQGILPLTIWPYEEVGHTQDAKKEVKALNPSSVFATPKPERLIERVLTLATNPGDLVLDSFLGSGTTAAVALKMNRKFIGIEIGDHVYTHCKVRLDKIIAGENYGGLPVDMFTQKHGYRFYELAPSLMNKDNHGEYVINEAYNADMLAEAIALHEGFTYQPDEKLFWKQSIGSEKSFLFVTTRHVNSNLLASIHDTMEDGEYLLVACRSFDKGADKLYKNISVKKIPQMILDDCEYDRENYNFNIFNPPVYKDEDDEEDCEDNE